MRIICGFLYIRFFVVIEFVFYCIVGFNGIRFAVLRRDKDFVWSMGIVVCGDR